MPSLLFIVLKMSELIVSERTKPSSIVLVMKFLPLKVLTISGGGYEIIVDE